MSYRGSMDDAGLSPAPAESSKFTNSTRMTQQEFADPFGDHTPSEPMRKSAAVRKGMQVRLKNEPKYTGTVTDMGKDCCIVQWDGASKGVYRFDSLIPK